MLIENHNSVITGLVQYAKNVVQSDTAAIWIEDTNVDRIPIKDREIVACCFENDKMAGQNRSFAFGRGWIGAMYEYALLKSDHHSEGSNDLSELLIPNVDDWIAQKRFPEPASIDQIRQMRLQSFLAVSLFAGEHFEEDLLSCGHVVSLKTGDTKMLWVPGSRAVSIIPSPIRL